jgi:hypothetical protein
MNHIRKFWDKSLWRKKKAATKKEEKSWGKRRNQREKQIKN